jgi:hypothetical protein
VALGVVTDFFVLTFAFALTLAATSGLALVYLPLRHRFLTFS